MARKAKKGTQLKTQGLTIRMNPQVKFALELMARKQHRTLTLVVEWALQQAILDPAQGLGDILDKVWDPMEPDRFVKMALHCPELLTYEEQLLWKMICEEEYFCCGRESKGLYETVRRQWDELSLVLDGTKQPMDFASWDALRDTEQIDDLSEKAVLPSKGRKKGV
jgi:hypothetical protein